MMLSYDRATNGRMTTRHRHAWTATDPGRRISPIYFEAFPDRFLGRLDQVRTE